MDNQDKRCFTPTLTIATFASAALGLVLVFMPFFFPPSGHSGSNFLAGLGRFHLLILHFPVAILPLVPLFEIIKRLRPAALPLLGIGVLSSVAASFLGILLAANDGFSGELVEKHMWGCIIATLLALFAFVFKMLSEKMECLAVVALYRMLLLVTLISLIGGTHNGASLVHGETFLSEKFTPLGTRTIDPNESAYTQLIKPIFSTHCYSCHSAAKVKGGLRMDDMALLLEGGDGGMPGIEPGNLEDSEVYYRITLAPDKKAFMPPSGHIPLTEEQIGLIAWWIESGASAEASVADLQTSNPMALIKLKQ